MVCHVFLKLLFLENPKNNLRLVANSLPITVCLQTDQNQNHNHLVPYPSEIKAECISTQGIDNFVPV